MRVMLVANGWPTASADWRTAMTDNQKWVRFSRSDEGTWPEEGQQVLVCGNKWPHMDRPYQAKFTTGLSGDPKFIERSNRVFGPQFWMPLPDRPAWLEDSDD